jgi:hypothetical protein
MTGPELVVARNLGIVMLIVVSLVLLSLLHARELVKADVRKRDGTPVSVRWSFWGPSWSERLALFGTMFHVKYQDLLGNIHEGWCLVPRHSWRQVRWLRDEVTGTIGAVLDEES